MLQKIQYYFIPIEDLKSNYQAEMKNLFGMEDVSSTLSLLNSFQYDRIENIAGYGLCGIKPKIIHNNFEQYEVSDFMTAYALFVDNTIRRGNYFIVDINTNVYLNREMHSNNPKTQEVTDDSSTSSEYYYNNNNGDGIDGHMLEACLTSIVSRQESKDSFKLISVPRGTNSITSVKTKGSNTDLGTETFFDSGTLKVYILAPLELNEVIQLCYSPLSAAALSARSGLSGDLSGGLSAGDDGGLGGGFGPDGGQLDTGTKVVNISGFDMSRVYTAVAGNNIVDGASKGGRLLVPFGRWILFSIRLWVYLKIPTVIGPLANRGPAWESGELADTIVDYYKQTVSSALNIWGNLPNLNPGEQAMRMVLKATFKLYYAGGLLNNADLMKTADGLIRVAVLTFWFGAFLKQIPPPGSVSNIISPVIFPGLPLVTPPTPNIDSAQMAMEFGFMFTIHSLTIAGFEIGMVPAGPVLVPVPYPFVAMI